MAHILAHVKRGHDMARPKSSVKSIHTAVRLPEDLHERLSQAGHGALANEIKRRLEVSLTFDEMDPATRELLDAALAMTGLITGDTGVAWHANAYLRAALAEAITTWLAERVPGDADAPSTDANASIAASATWLREGDSPKVAGEKLLGLYKLLRTPQEAAARYHEKMRTNPVFRQAQEQWDRERAAVKGRKKP
jgi:hypothetical protein